LIVQVALGLAVVSLVFYTKTFLQLLILVEVALVLITQLIVTISSEEGIFGGLVSSILFIAAIAVEGAVGLSVFLRTVQMGSSVSFSRKVLNTTRVFRSTKPLLSPNTTPTPVQHSSEETPRVVYS